MNAFEKARGHLHTINEHKREVTKLCFRCGLIRQGLRHDLSKYSPIELKTGFRYYQGFRSPINAQKEEIGYSTSWLHHKGRNPHHWEYWLDFNQQGIYPVPMEFNYVVEMWCDRVAACKVYEKNKYTLASPLRYYMKNRGHVMIHPQTQKQIVYLLAYLRDHGEEAAIAHIRQLLREYRQTGSVTIPPAR